MIARGCKRLCRVATVDQIDRACALQMLFG